MLAIKLVNVDEHDLCRAASLAPHFVRQYPDRIGMRNGVVFTTDGFSNPLYVFRTKTQIVVRGRFPTMPSKELTHEELKAIVAAKMADPNTTAADILSTILAAIQEPTEAMLKEAHKAEDESAVHNYGSLPSATDYWDFMLAASALGEQSE